MTCGGALLLLCRVAPAACLPVAGPRDAYARLMDWRADQRPAGIWDNELCAQCVAANATTASPMLRELSAQALDRISQARPPAAIRHHSSDAALSWPVWASSDPAGGPVRPRPYRTGLIIVLGVPVAGVTVPDSRALTAVARRAVRLGAPRRTFCQGNAPSTQLNPLRGPANIVPPLCHAVRRAYPYVYTRAHTTMYESESHIHAHLGIHAYMHT
jgi:hypothetical protein